MAWRWFGGGRGRWFGPWPGRGPWSWLPPWQRPGWWFGRGAWWLFLAPYFMGTYGYPGYTTWYRPPFWYGYPTYY